MLSSRKLCCVERDLLYTSHIYKSGDSKQRADDGTKINVCVSLLQVSICSFYWILAPLWDLSSLNAQSWIARKKTITPKAHAVAGTTRSPESTAAQVLRKSMLSISVPTRRACFTSSGVFAVHRRPPMTASRTPNSR